ARQVGDRVHLRGVVDGAVDLGAQPVRGATPVDGQHVDLVHDDMARAEPQVRIVLAALPVGDQLAGGAVDDVGRVDVAQVRGRLGRAVEPVRVAGAHTGPGGPAGLAERGGDAE